MGRVSGDPQPFEQPLRIHYDDAGAVTTIPYEGTSSFGVELIAKGDLVIPYDITETFGKTRVELNYPYDFINSSPQTEWLGIWEFFANESDKDLLTSFLPNSIGVTNSQTGQFTPMGNLPNGGIGQISGNDAQLVRKALDVFQQNIPIGQGWFYAPTDALFNPLTYTVITSAPGVLPVTTTQQNFPPAENPVGCFTLFNLMIRGSDSFEMFAPVLRLTQTVTAQYAIGASMMNVRRIISSESLPDIENIPDDLLFSLPIDDVPDSFIQVPGDLLYGWFKKFPSIRQVARLKWQIAQEWQYGLWPVAVYGQPL